MKCSGCAGRVKGALERLPGVQQVDVDLTQQCVMVYGRDASKRTIDAALKEIGKEGTYMGQSTTLHP